MGDSLKVGGVKRVNAGFTIVKGLDGKTPTEVCGIEVKGDNKWLTIIQNASHPTTVNSLEIPSIPRQLNRTLKCNKFKTQFEAKERTKIGLLIAEGTQKRLEVLPHEL